VRRALLALVVGTAAASISGAAAGGGIGLSASPLRLTLKGASARTVVVRNPGRRALLVDVSRAGLARSLRGRPQVRRAGGAASWLRFRPRRFRLAPHAKKTLHVVSAPPRKAAPGDHPELVLLTTRPLGVKHVRVRLRVGLVVDLRVRGRIVRRLDPLALTVRRDGAMRLLELRLVNRGNVLERLGSDGLRVSLLSDSRKVASLRPHSQELLPHSAGIAVFAYRGPVRGAVVARVDFPRPVRGRRRSFHVRL
jgi:hypothetical protein